MVKLKKEKNIHERLFWLFGLLGRTRFWYLASRSDIRILNAINIFMHSIISMVILGIAASLTSWQLIFPSLGPTIFLQFYAPSSPMASPRNTVLCHFLGALTGWLCYTALTYLHPLPPDSPDTETVKIVTAALALGICGVGMSLTGIIHPPAASTTLIASLGLMNGPSGIFMVGLAALFLCMQAWTMHKFAGIKYPLWSPYTKDNGPDIETKLGRLSPGNRGEGTNAVSDVAARLASRQKLK